MLLQSFLSLSPSAPSAPPVDVRAVATSHDIVRVNWGSVPCQQRNGPITGFVVNITFDGEQPKTVTTGLTSSANVTGLSPLRTYAISVAAISEQGSGPHSEPQLVQTLPTG